MTSLQLAVRLAPRGARLLSTTAKVASVSMKQSFESAANKGVVPSTEGYQRVRDLQNEFNASTDKLVWEKRGFRDSLPMNLTFGLCLVGLSIAVWTIYDMSYPKIP